MPTAAQSVPNQPRTLGDLRPGDRIEVDHDVRVGFRSWRAKTEGVVVEIDRRRHGLHTDRNFDDKVFSDVIVLRRDDGELTTVALDEFSVVRRLVSSE